MRHVHFFTMSIKFCDRSDLAILMMFRILSAVQLLKKRKGTMSNIMHTSSVTFYVRWDTTVLYSQHPFVDSLLSTYDSLLSTYDSLLSTYAHNKVSKIKHFQNSINIYYLLKNIILRFAILSSFCIFCLVSLSISSVCSGMQKKRLSKTFKFKKNLHTQRHTT